MNSRNYNLAFNHPRTCRINASTISELSSNNTCAAPSTSIRFLSTDLVFAINIRDPIISVIRSFVPCTTTKGVVMSLIRTENRWTDFRMAKPVEIRMRP